ncbi:hypothetical protein [Stetteria hydrogenophila]
MRAIRRLASAAATAARALELAALLAALHLRLRAKLALWRVGSRLRFRASIRSLPPELAGSLAREYGEAVSSVGLPGILQLARPARRRPQGGSASLVRGGRRAGEG